MATFAFPPSPISSPSHYTSSSPRSNSPFLAIPQQSSSTNGSTPRRPALTLNTTSCSRSLGRGHTGLRLDTAAPSSPTVLNTYKNTYDNAYTSAASPSSQSRTSSPLRTSTKMPRPTLRVQELVSESIPSFEAAPSSPLRSSTSSDSQQQPRRSILVSNRSVTMTQTDVASSTAPRRKAVSFSEGPTEYITNTLYTLRHCDIPSRSSSPAVTDDPETKLNIPSITWNQSQKHALSPSPTTDAPLPLRTCHHATEDDYETDPKTPISGRRKRQREWVWTLGPLPGLPSAHVDSTNTYSFSSSSSSSSSSLSLLEDD